MGLCTEWSIEHLFFEQRYNRSVSVSSHRESHDPLLDFCTITKACLCWICLGVTHHTYLSKACVHPGSCLILNALHQKHSSPVKQYTCTPRYTSLILLCSRCPIYIPSTSRMLRRENKLLEGLQPRIIQVLCVSVGKNQNSQDHCGGMLSGKTSGAHQHPHCVRLVVRPIHHWASGVFPTW